MTDLGWCALTVISLCGSMTVLYALRMVLDDRRQAREQEGQEGASSALLELSRAVEELAVAGKALEERVEAQETLGNSLHESCGSISGAIPALETRLTAAERAIAAPKRVRA